MAKAKLESVYGELGLRFRFKCEDCGAEDVGTSSVRYTIREPVSLGELVAAVSAVEGVPQVMPIGWASYGNATYRCPRCRK